MATVMRGGFGGMLLPANAETQPLLEGYRIGAGLIPGRMRQARLYKNTYTEFAERTEVTERKHMAESIATFLWPRR
jgi:hypothetical protein